jgi:hypothetical protein
MEAAVEMSDRRSAELAEDFVGRREPAGGLLREHQPAVDGDVEDPAASFDEPRLDPRRLGDPGRQTGGLRIVVSLHAVGYGDHHGLSLVAGIRRRAFHDQSATA